MTREEELAEVVHQAYLDTAYRLGWPVKPELNVPFAHLPESAKELDRATVAAVLAHLGERGEQDARTGHDQRCERGSDGHQRACPVLISHEFADCTCRCSCAARALGTEQSMHQAWRKRAEEAERDLRAQAAAHADSVRQIQVRMVRVEEALRQLYDISYHVASEISLTPGDDPVADQHFADWRAALDVAEALFAEIASPPSAKGEQA